MTVNPDGTTAARRRPETLRHPSPPSDRKSVAHAAAETRTRSLLDYLEAYALAGCLLAAAAFFTVYGPTSDTFLTGANLQILIAGQVVVATVALALLIPLCANEWDLSVGATAGLAAVFSASVMSSSGLVVGVVVGLAVGALVGVVNAVIITRFNVNAVIATLGMLTIIAGVINLKTGGLTLVSNIPETLTDLGSNAVFGIPLIAIVLILVGGAVHYLLEYIPYGRYLYALGANPAAARLVGLQTRQIRAGAFVLAGLVAAVAGILAVARAGGADPRLGDQLLLPAFAAAFLSAAAIKPGRYNVGGLFVAVYFLAVVNNGLNLAGAQPYVNSFVNGTALIVGLALATYLGRRRRGNGP